MNPTQQPTPEPVKESARWTRRGKGIYDETAKEVAIFARASDAEHTLECYNAAVEALEREVERLKDNEKRLRDMLKNAAGWIDTSEGCGDYGLRIYNEIRAEIGG